jgi:predicted ester cyclase
MSTHDETGKSPSGGDVVQVVRRYDAALREHDWGALQGLAAKDFTFHNTNYGSMQERAGFLAWARLIGAAYPDFFLSIDRTLFDNDVVTIWFHEDTGFTVQMVSSGVRVPSGVLRLRVHHGSIVEMWSNYDEFGLLRQRPVQAVRRS